MSLMIKNMFIKKVMKGAIPINAFFAFLILQPLEPVIYFPTMAKELLIQATIAASLISLLFPIGIKKQMAIHNAESSKWEQGSFNQRFSSIIPKNKYLALPIWMGIAAIFSSIPMYFTLQALDITEMTGWGYFVFKMAQSWTFCVGLSYLVIVVNVSER